MKIAMLQLNFTVGDFEGNTAKILNGYRGACAMGADIVVSTELALFGYPPKDMLERPEYLAQQDACLTKLMPYIGSRGLILGIAERNTTGVGKPLYNSAVLIRDMGIAASWRKKLLPTYDVFDERRYFEPSRSDAVVFDYSGLRIGVLICEDIWGGTENPYGGKIYDLDPLVEMAGKKPDVLMVINGSPYYWGKGDVRYDLVVHVARRIACPVVYVNQVGGNDDLVFDGRSFAVNKYGRGLSSLTPYETDIEVIDTDDQSCGLAQYWLNDHLIGDLYDVLVLGTRDYVQKTGHDSVVVALSGGIDSAVTACIAVAALGKNNVLGLALPCDPYSGEESVEDARMLAKNLGIDFSVISIRELYDTFGRALAPVIEWYEPGERPEDVTEENIQARIRGAVMMAITNRRRRGKKSLVLSTGNKSELSQGYCTMYGDMVGGLAPLSDVWKTDVYKLAKYICGSYDIIPMRTRTKPPSAGLRVGQQDSDSLPPYEALDPILKAYIEEQLTMEKIVSRGHSEDVVRQVIERVNHNEFKRRQMAPGLKVTNKAFGTGRRWPIAAMYR